MSKRGDIVIVNSHHPNITLQLGLQITSQIAARLYGVFDWLLQMRITSRPYGAFDWSLLGTEVGITSRLH